MAQTIEVQRENRLYNLRQTIDRMQVRLDCCRADIITGRITAQKLEYVFAGETKRVELELKALYKVLPKTETIAP